MTREEVLNHLMELDREFCEEAQSQGALAWAKNFAEEGVLVSGGHRPYVIGKDNVANAISGLYALEKLVFYWEPKLAEVSDDFTMGYTTGIFTRQYHYQGKNFKERGKYTTIWKKFADEWKIILDVGNEEQEEV